MQEQSGIQAEFDALCSQYGFPVGDSNYYFLLDLFRRRKQGKSFTDEEILADFSALDIARMLKQLSFSSGNFSLLVGGGSKDYSSPALVGILKQSLEEALGARVEKGKKHMILSKGYGAGGDEGRAFLIDYPEGCTPMGEGFSNKELDAIIAFEEGLEVEVKKMQGNKERWEKEGESRLPELGKLSEWIIDNYLPKEWQAVDKYNFVADYLFRAGFLDFKGEVWKGGFRDKSRKEKDRMIRNWHLSYHNSLQKTK
ncbi:MAG: hypothetical protein K5850_06975 [Bacteroidales bacterium]|nr:hypothetical protein [Bacteroidales bacterium]